MYMGEAVAKIGGGRYMIQKYTELVGPGREGKNENADEIIEKIKGKLKDLGGSRDERI